MDMGVGHAGLVKLCRFLNMKPLTHNSFTKHAHVICNANKVVMTRMLDNASDVVRRVYRDTDPSIGEDDTIDLIVSFDGSWTDLGSIPLQRFRFRLQQTFSIPIPTPVVSVRFRLQYIFLFRF